MVEEAEFSSIRRSVLLAVDTRLRAAQDANDFDRYQIPILTKFKENQPYLFEYVATRGRAIERYKSLLVTNGYMIGTTLGHDIMTSNISSLGRTVDITPWHVSVHDPIWSMAATMVSVEGDPALGDQMLDRQWFAMTWLDYSFDPEQNFKVRRSTFEQSEFVEQVNKAPILLDYLRHLDLFFRANSQPLKQAVFTGIFDQMMIYRHGLEDIDNPDQRYIVGDDGIQEMPFSPIDIVFLRQQALKLFGRNL